MANRRKLKKDINYLCGELMAECVSALHYNKADADDAMNIILGIASMQEDMICRASHVEPGLTAKLFFLKLKQDMAHRTDDLIEQIKNLA